MATSSRLNKDLWNNITKLKLLGKPDDLNRFVIEQNPFGDDDEEQVTTEKDEYVIVGRIFPKSDIYKQTALRIEMKLAADYPKKAPIVRILTPIYHPNVEDDGTFCHQLLSNTSKWEQNPYKSLADVVKAIVKHIDEPNPNFAINFERGNEYVHNKTEFDRKALEVLNRNLITRE